MNSKFRWKRDSPCIRKLAERHGGPQVRGNWSWETSTLPNRSNILVAYTDGITEAASVSGELWGLERLEKLLRSCGQMAPTEMIERILSEVSDFANGEPQRDGVTVVVMKVQEGCDI